MANEPNPRDGFLIEMYREMSSHLNRHMLLSWQSIGVVGGALAVFVLGDKLEATMDGRLDFAIGIVILLCAWSICHVLDANNWFERNLHIITNIERQFLRASDSKEIHYFFTKHRSARSEKGLIQHLRIQLHMAAGLWAMLIGYHFYQRVVPGWGLPVSHFEVVRSIPYLLTVAAAVYCRIVWMDSRADYRKLLEQSPGKEVQPAKS
jgi:hypothetical protein